MTDRQRRMIMTPRQIAEENERKYNPEGLDDGDRFDDIERAIRGYSSADFGTVFGDNLNPASVINQY